LGQDLLGFPPLPSQPPDVSADHRPPALHGESIPHAELAHHEPKFRFSFVLLEL
jgi:hypothetical protein